MRNHSVIGGIILIFLGLFFLFRQMDVPYLDQISFWPLVLIGVGLFFIFTAIFDYRRDGGIFPGVILTGIGVHFLGQELFPADWPTHWAVYTFIVAIAFFAQFLLTREKGTLVPAVVLLAVTLFSTVWNDLWHDIPWPMVWPIVLIVVGIVILFRRK